MLLVLDNVKTSCINNIYIVLNVLYNCKNFKKFFLAFYNY